MAHSKQRKKSEEQLPEVYAREIRQTVEAWDKSGKHLVPTFITHEIVKRHVAGLARANEHTPFYEHFAHKGCRSEVGRYISKTYGDEAADAKKPDTFFGYEYIQRHYVITRDGEDIAVPIDDLTDAEIEARVEMLRKRGLACLAHADELERYRSLREKVA